MKTRLPGILVINWAQSFTFSSNISTLRYSSSSLSGPITLGNSVVLVEKYSMPLPKKQKKQKKELSDALKSLL